jgi:hypothetical protein
VVPFQGKGILFAFPARLFAVKFVFSAATRISVSNAPPPFFGSQVQVCAVDHSCTRPALFALKMCWTAILPCSATSKTLAELKRFAFIAVLLAQY